MKSRDECINKIKDETKQALLNPVANGTPLNEYNEMYRNTLKNLIIQGMIRLLEEDVELLVRQQDIDLT
jgi:hypothetical protein